jgi:hypothetical protein
MILFYITFWNDFIFQSPNYEIMAIILLFQTMGKVSQIYSL